MTNILVYNQEIKSFDLNSITLLLALKMIFMISLKLLKGQKNFFFK
jgi:hypothetical protein